MKKPDAEVTHSDEITPAELDAMAQEAESHVADVCAIEGDDDSNAIVAGKGGVHHMHYDGDAFPAKWEEIAAPLHALDDAPVNSKIVKLKEGAILQTPSGGVLLPEGDSAHKLPEGARIRKVADGAFEAVQLSAVEEHPVLETNSAASAIAQFVAHFHPRS